MACKWPPIIKRPMQICLHLTCPGAFALVTGMLPGQAQGAYADIQGPKWLKTLLLV